MVVQLVTWPADLANSSTLFCKVTIEDVYLIFECSGFQNAVYLFKHLRLRKLLG